MKSRSSLGVVGIAAIASLVLPALVYGQSASPEAPGSPSAGAAASPALSRARGAAPRAHPQGHLRGTG